MVQNYSDLITAVRGLVQNNILQSQKLLDSYCQTHSEHLTVLKQILFDQDQNVQYGLIIYINKLIRNLTDTLIEPLELKKYLNQILSCERVANKHLFLPSVQKLVLMLPQYQKNLQSLRSMLIKPNVKQVKAGLQLLAQLIISCCNDVIEIPKIVADYLQPLQESLKWLITTKRQIRLTTQNAHHIKSAFYGTILQWLKVARRLLESCECVGLVETVISRQSFRLVGFEMLDEMLTSKDEIIYLSDQGELNECKSESLRLLKYITQFLKSRDSPFRMQLFQRIAERLKRFERTFQSLVKHINQLQEHNWLTNLISLFTVLPEIKDFKFTMANICRQLFVYIFQLMKVSFEEIQTFAQSPQNFFVLAQDVVQKQTFKIPKTEAGKLFQVLVDNVDQFLRIAVFECIQCINKQINQDAALLILALSSYGLINRPDLLACIQQAIKRKFAKLSSEPIIFSRLLLFASYCSKYLQPVVITLLVQISAQKINQKNALGITSLDFLSNLFDISKDYAQYSDPILKLLITNVQSSAAVMLWDVLQTILKTRLNCLSQFFALQLINVVKKRIITQLQRPNGLILVRNLNLLKILINDDQFFNLYADHLQTAVQQMMPKLLFKLQYVDDLMIILASSLKKRRCITALYQRAFSILPKLLVSQKNVIQFFFSFINQVIQHCFQYLSSNQTNLDMLAQILNQSLTSQNLDFDNYGALLLIHKAVCLFPSFQINLPMIIKISQQQNQNSCVCLTIALLHILKSQLLGKEKQQIISMITVTKFPLRDYDQIVWVHGLCRLLQCQYWPVLTKLIDCLGGQRIKAKKQQHRDFSYYQKELNSSFKGADQYQYFKIVIRSLKERKPEQLQEILKNLAPDQFERFNRTIKYQRLNDGKVRRIFKKVKLKEKLLQQEKIQEDYKLTRTHNKFKSKN